MVMGLFAGICSADSPTARPKSKIRGGNFSPLYGYGKDQVTQKVGPFLVDTFPVTNGEYFEFVKRSSSFRPNSVPRNLADEGYLKHWAVVGEEREPHEWQKKIPVTNVSWFAAEAYCVAEGGRLPTILEWEYVAAASEKSFDASRDPEFVQQLLTWYSQPNNDGVLAVVGLGKPNKWGVHDLHGLIWEWASDFNSVFVVGDNRREGEDTKNLFCGDATLNATDRANYAAFMRYALRNSLQGPFTMTNLGFRCAYDH